MNGIVTLAASGLVPRMAPTSSIGASSAAAAGGGDNGTTTSTTTSVPAATTSVRLSLSDDVWEQLVKEESQHEPIPAIEASTVWIGGIIVFVSAMIWPPLLLVVTYGLSMFLPYSFRTNDSGESRRRLLDQFDKQDTLSHSRHEWPTKDVTLETGYWTTNRGSLLYYSLLIPTTIEGGDTTTMSSVKAVVCHCHGYGDTPTFTKRRELAILAQHGIAVVMVDCEGHGRSDGALGLIKDWNVLTNDLHSFFQETATTKFPGRKVFLMGESMGGAVAYTIIKAHPDVYSGVNFLAPMCKIGKALQPSEWVITVGRLLAGPTGTATWLGYLPISPVNGNLKMLTYKVAGKRALNSRVPSQFARKPRLATGRELLNATTMISNSLGEFHAPFLVQHGRADRVTDPQLSQALYDECQSNDKTIRLYDGMWHSLTAGETDENVELVLNDSIQWILERAT